MRNGFFPVFTKGRVLKKESVEYLRDFPYDLASLIYRDYSEGIIFGFSITSEKGYVHISKGAVKYQGNIIVVPENTLEIVEYGKFLYAKLLLGKIRETEDSKVCAMEFKLDLSQFKSWNEMELGRFSLNPGAVLRCEYDSFSDMRTQENTLDITRVSYAGNKTPTLHPKVLKEYARALLAGSSEAPDISFALMCLNSEVVHKDSIQWHIAKKNNTAYEEYTLPALYEKLLEILPQYAAIGKRERVRGRGPTIG